ncbi:Nucleotidylyl transferase [Massarina eburnea CBS 473.64]|uniref:arginine--tRNA ligase n=1 Tax=Massarina eburnea CBS 473.64 TaxID=1395130 RepID=A0A6A6SFA7_9PLEO|nr:Nucleotidylyl transferase [Massarina eburnea CBS 473.64]
MATTTYSLAELETVFAGLSVETPIPQYSDSDVLHNPLDLCRSYLADLLCKVAECKPATAYRSIQWPNNIFGGDLTVTLPKLRPGVKPNEFALDLMNKFPNDHSLFLLPMLDGVHLRVFIVSETLSRLFLPYILDRKTTFGSHDTPSFDGLRKKLVVEFSSPNIASEFQGKHLRSTIIGAFVSKMHEALGWEVTKLNYLGDWGKPIALLKVGWDKFGNEDAYQANPVGHLLDVYHQIEELFQPEMVASRQARDEAARNGQDEGEAQLEIENRGVYAERNAASKELEDGDEEALAFWKRVREANIENYKDFYAELGVEFDEYTGESQIKPETMAEVEQLLKEKEICKESAGAWVIHMQDYGLKAGTAIIRDRTGATTYLLRDLAAIIERSRKFEFDKMIIVAANDNNMHFIHVHHILKAIGMEHLANKVQHLRFSEVSKMSEKLGKGYRPQAIISHCEEAIAAALQTDKEKAEMFGCPAESAKALGVSSLVTHELSTRTASTHSFDTCAMTSFKPGTGLDLQFWHAKLGEILAGHAVAKQLSDEDYEALADDNPANLLRILVQYPEVTHAAYQSLEPAAIVTYLASVTEQLAECLSENEEVIEDGVDPFEDGVGAEIIPKEDTANDEAIAPGFIALYEATRVVLENGMHLLGLVPYANVGAERSDTPIAE